MVKIDQFIFSFNDDFVFYLRYGLRIRPQSYIPYEENLSHHYQPYRLSVNNPLFFTHQESNTSISKLCSTLSNRHEH